MSVLLTILMVVACVTAVAALVFVLVALVWCGYMLCSGR